MSDAKGFLRQAVELARENVEAGGRPFGAVVVNGGKIIAAAVNEMHLSHDVTDHAELLALRDAVRTHGPDALKGSSVYASGHPCPMCMAAMRLAGVATVAYAYSNEDGAPFNLSTADIYADLKRPFAEQSMAISHLPLESKPGQNLYKQWAEARDSRK
ncbi:nucleoside deaminase [Aquamicrobium lusatiense]|uniref:nucleoside deaminase n=1 Tax=Aquamicrobium lusatiense TaxID=89772 RepID=UPI002456A654|nr:nucleoside deaminase [Aquamicrobium lusatiense]MDH4992346.1 nucleoside deaminase [Aquamicrobium lusatiense]